MGRFIKVELDEAACAGDEGCRSLVALCPVDVFKEIDGRIVVDEAAEDECTLCGLCVEACPEAVKIEKLY